MAAERHINSILEGLKQYSQETANPIGSSAAAIDAVSSFLSKFDITCLRAYLRGTTIPTLEDAQTSIVLVSDYVRHIQATEPNQFQSFLVMVQGHMLANALLCPDLTHATHDYNGVTFYLDTPLLVQRLGLEGAAKEDAARELLVLLTRLRGKVAVFDHSREELKGVLTGAAAHLEATTGRGAIVAEARLKGTTRSDLFLLAESLEDRLSDADIQVHATPSYVGDLQIDEEAFEHGLDDWVGYRNPRAKLYDINSVRSIYVIRAKTHAPSIEKSKAVFITSNSSFAVAAWEYGRHYESSQEVSSVITDFTLANAAWLKAPVGAPNIPTTQLLAFAYAALEPSDGLLDKYMSEIDRLVERGTITTRDHELLRSSPLVYAELMHYTLGDEAALTEETVTQTLARVSSEIKAEVSLELQYEQEAHGSTKSALAEESVRNQQMLGGLYWRSRAQAKLFARIISLGVAVTIALLFLMGFLAELDFVPIASSIAWILMGSSGVLTLVAVLDIVLGFSVRGFHPWLESAIFRWLLTRESKAIGIDLSNAPRGDSP